MWIDKARAPDKAHALVWTGPLQTAVLSHVLNRNGVGFLAEFTVVGEVPCPVAEWQYVLQVVNTIK